MIKFLKPVLLSFFLTSSIWAQSSFDAPEDKIWQSNTGWISFRHDQPSSPAGVRLDESFVTGFAWGANTGWINFGSGPTNGFSYSNSLGDHGVNLDERGNLSGYAWCANTGWLNFDWANSSDLRRPRLNLVDGSFRGYAWSPNIGWVNLQTGDLTLQAILREDSDSDGIADAWEMRFFGNLTTANGSSNSDTDAQTDLDEYASGSNPTISNAPLSLILEKIGSRRTSATVKFNAESGRLYQIESTDNITDPLSWAPVLAQPFTPAQTGVTTRSFSFTSAPGTSYFFRVIALRPFSN